MPGSAKPNDADLHEFLNHGAAREGTRHRLKADVRLIRQPGEIAEAVMADISSTGMGLDGLLHFEEECAVVVDFPNGHRRSGRMVWRDAFHSGLLFAEPLSIFQLEKLMFDLCRRPFFERADGPALT